MHLNKQQKIEIIAQHTFTDTPMAELSWWYGVTVATIQSVIDNKPNIQRSGPENMIIRKYLRDGYNGKTLADLLRWEPWLN